MAMASLRSWEHNCCVSPKCLSTTMFAPSYSWSLNAFSWLRYDVWLDQPPTYHGINSLYSASHTFFCLHFFFLLILPNFHSLEEVNVLHVTIWKSCPFSCSDNNYFVIASLLASTYPWIKQCLLLAGEGDCYRNIPYCVQFHLCWVIYKLHSEMGSLPCVNGQTLQCLIESIQMFFSACTGTFEASGITDYLTCRVNKVVST